MRAHAFVRMYVRVRTLERSRPRTRSRLPTNPLLYVRVSLLVPGSGNTPIKAVLHGHANNSTESSIKTYARAREALACEPPVWLQGARDAIADLMTALRNTQFSVFLNARAFPQFSRDERNNLRFLSRGTMIYIVRNHK